MIFYTTNILAAPLLLGIWAVDIYILVISARLIFDLLEIRQENKVHLNLCKLTDPAFDLTRKLVSKVKTYPPHWLCWTILIVTSLLLRQILITLLMS